MARFLCRVQPSSSMSRARAYTGNLDTGHCWAAAALEEKLPSIGVSPGSSLSSLPFSVARSPSGGGWQDVKVTQAASRRLRLNKSPTDKRGSQQGVQSIFQSQSTETVWKAGQPQGQHERWWKALLKPSVVPGPSSGPRRWRTRLVSLLVGEAGKLVPPLGILAQETCSPGFRAQESSSALAGLCFSWLQRGGEWKGWIKYPL